MALGALTLLAGIALYQFPDIVPVSCLVVPVVISNLVLSPRTLPWFVVYVLSVVVVVVSASTAAFTPMHVTGVVIAFVIGLIILVASFRRSRLGVAGARGESMLVDLRDRITKQGEHPRAAGGLVLAKAAMRSAGGTSFAGDFMVAARSREGTRLEVAVVDVSGKGEQAGTRSLLLSGAFGGLLGRAAGRGLPPGGQRLPAPPGLERGVRHRGAPLPRPGHRRVRAAHRRAPAGRAAARRLRPLGRARGPRARARV